MENAVLKGLEVPLIENTLQSAKSINAIDNGATGNQVTPAR